MQNNIHQDKAIKKLDGPVLIIAGPGTGKTYTLVERVAYMVGDKGIDPSEIMITTFTNKAAIEILDRISLKFKEKNIIKDVNEMLLGNFHGVCRRILNEYIHLTPLSPNYTNIDDMEQKYFIKRNLHKFTEIKNFNRIITPKNAINNIQQLVNKVCEYGILERDSRDEKYQVIFDIVKKYEEMLIERNMIDFSHILFYTYKLLSEHREVRESLQKRINYIMVDEYQDTNMVQEKIIFSILNDNKNICVVGDDDQSLYRFRGATVGNILEFDNKFSNVEVINLRQNYRSEDKIVKFYSDYMKKNIDENQNLIEFRKQKLLFTDYITNEDRVVKVVESTEEQWRYKILQIVKELKRTNKIQNINEIAILCSSVNEPKIRKLIALLKKEDISVYIPKSSTLLSKTEVKKLIGAIYAIFKKYMDKYIRSYDSETRIFLEKIYINFKKSMKKTKDIDEYIKNMSNFISTQEHPIDLYDISYRLFAYDPFYTYMQEESKAKNLSRFLELFKSFSLISGIHKINVKNIDIFVNLFFFEFISFIKDQNITEFEEDTVIPVENTMSVLTIHASKGMEYPIVIMASLWDSIFSYYENGFNKLMNSFIKEFSYSNSKEPKKYVNKLDYYRKNYTGFSRAKELLILAGIKYGEGSVSETYKDVLNDLPFYDIDRLNLNKKEKKVSKEKKIYAFTTDILPYLKNPIEYYYTNILKFSFPKDLSLHYGSLVHETIEFINKSIIMGKNIDENIIRKNLIENANKKEKNGAYNLKKKYSKKALDEVMGYYKDLRNIGKPIDSELEIVYSTENYILVANIDMIYKKEDGSLHIMDFKTGTPPDELENHDFLYDYMKQLNLYCYLYENTKGVKIESTGLYFTDLSVQKHKYIFDYDEEINKETINIIEETIKKIENEEYDAIKNSKHRYLKFFLDKLV